MSVRYAEELGPFTVKFMPAPLTRKTGLRHGVRADGYGTKITSDYMLKYDKDRLANRVYIHCISNVGSHYILKGRERFYVREHHLEDARDAAMREKETE